MTARVVSGFVHTPGVHCGSTAMADALRMVGINLSEPMALGLGAGPSFMLFEGRGLSPSTFFLGRSVTYEQDLCRLIHVRFDEGGVASFDAAWQQMRASIDADRPLLVLSDIRYLPHYQSTTHFNGHRIVLAGYDDELALVADAHFPGLQEVPLEAFRASLTSDAPPLVTTETIFGSLELPSRPFDLAEIAPATLRAAAESALEESTHQGLGGVRRLAKTIGLWSEASDWKWRARFGYQVIERRGCGGGLFRRLYAEFLKELSERLERPSYGELARLSVAAADSWTALASELRLVSEAESPSFDRAARLTEEIVERERVLWESIRDATAAR